MATPISAFNNQLIAFVEDLAETYTEEKDIRTALDALKALKKANPKLLHTGFMNYIYPDFAKPVMEMDENALISKAKTALESEYKDYAFAYIIFDRHWSTMSEANKEAIWKWCKVLVLLAERATN
ncbi:hypothetical protein EBU71_19450 [bacterium]|nr:hypothetical protein [Candidatus Elulimicrobium humile]